MAAEKLGASNGLILRLDTALRGANSERFEFDEHVLLLSQPAKLLMEGFGIEEDLLTLRHIQNRDHPTLISYREFPGEKAVRIQIFYVYGSEVTEITYNRSDGSLLGIHREGSTFPAHVSGSRWYGEDPESLLDCNPELEEILNKEQKLALKNEAGKLVSYYFFPNSDAHYYEYLEGCARILYYWDLSEDKWTYVAHSERDFGTDADNPDVFWRDYQNEAIDVHISPFGDFGVPREVEIGRLVENLFFPHLVKEELSPRDGIFLGINHDFLGVEKV